jgi:homocysteine S-methyltransferase
LAILSRAEPDLIAFETIPSKKEAEALAELLKEFPNVKGWLSFNCQVLDILMQNNES